MTQGTTMILILTPLSGLVETYRNVNYAQLVYEVGNWYLHIRYDSGQKGFTRPLKEIGNISSPGSTSFDLVLT